LIGHETITVLKQRENCQTKVQVLMKRKFSSRIHIDRAQNTTGQGEVHYISAPNKSHRQTAFRVRGRLTF